jgi:hypothetical protein
MLCFVAARRVQAIQNLGRGFVSRASNGDMIALIALPRGSTACTSARSTIVEVGHTEAKFVSKVSIIRVRRSEINAAHEIANAKRQQPGGACYVCVCVA